MGNDSDVLNQWKCPRCDFTKWVHPQVWLNMWCQNPRCPGNTRHGLSKMQRTKLVGRKGCITVFDEQESPEKEPGC